MIKINMGAWKRNFGEDWIHIDGCDLPHIQSHDIKLETFENNSIDLIYASHFIEYFDRIEVVDLLKGWLSKLKPGGTLRLAVPNFPILASIYRRTQDINLILGPLYGRMEMSGQMIYHKTAYDFVSLYELLVSIGFIKPELWNWREVDHGKFDDHSQAYYPHMNKENGTLVSLNVQCKKPQ